MEPKDFLVLKTTFLAELGDAYLFIQETLERGNHTATGSMPEARRDVEQYLSERWDALLGKLFEVPDEIRQGMEVYRAVVEEKVPSHEAIEARYDRVFARSLPEGQKLPGHIRDQLIAFERRILKVVGLIDAVQE